MNTVICSTSQEVQSALQSPRQGRTFLQALTILLLLDSLVLMTHCPLGPEITYQEKLLQHRIVAHSGFFLQGAINGCKVWQCIYFWSITNA